MKVYIVNSSGHDTSKAKEFGELVCLTEGKVNVFNTDRLIYDLKLKLHFMEKDDYVLLSGSILLNCIVSLLVMEKFGTINFLLYDFGKKNYIKRDLGRSLLD